MADEIKSTLRVNHSKAPKRNINPDQLSVDQTGTGVYSDTVNIGTSEENVSFSSEVGTEGWLYLENLDSTNYVTWGASATTPTMASIGRLEAGEYAWFRMEPSTTLRMQANTAACEVYYQLYED